MWNIKIGCKSEFLNSESEEWYHWDYDILILTFVMSVFDVEKKIRTISLDRT